MLKGGIFIIKLTKQEIEENKVDTIEQFKTLEYVKNSFINLDLYDIYLCGKFTLKVVCENKIGGYFEYDDMINDVVFNELEDYERELNLR